MTNQSSIEFPDWLPPAIRDIAQQILANTEANPEPVKAREVLCRLISDSRMKRVWKELYKKKREAYQPTEEFAKQASFSISPQARAKRLRASELRQKGGDIDESKAQVLEVEASTLESWPTQLVDKKWSEQDNGVRFFFHQSFHLALRDILLSTVTEIDEMQARRRTTARHLRAESENLRDFGFEEHALELQRIASDCEQDADWIEPGEDDPWVIGRHRGDEHLRGYVAHLANISREIFGHSLYNTLATITNVALDRNDVTGARVREMLHAAIDYGI